ncbi:DHH family phosphoesterase [Siminovitchia fordii]|uniref:SPBc2 prophage-derived single-strand DNA-specific exonuclease YorK n=1 Tax=Siminovitchia fordii TaxID=254759 RepID=A0ABQ4K9Z2_9BACI|nr:DHH family phosphoesterase [Siminovitchia fordii]GIN22538.1 putative SPBc2 prophage-derived single-strand DNA-specific exonuclease YorK [Siminovitchia fordii]
MKYEVIGKNNLLNPVETILNNRGIEDIQSFLNVSDKDIIPWHKLRNIDKAVECLLKHIQNKNKLFVQVDSDFDGISSSVMLINYLRHTFDKPNIQWRLQEGKQHGVILDTVPEDVDLVIIPDAGSNQFKEHRVLAEKGIDVIVLDHHEVTRESSDAVVVNNQCSPDYTNKSLTGAGIVYKFLQALDNHLSVNHADNYLDLVSMGLIADVADSRELETRYYMNKGLSKIQNKFLKSLFEKQSFSTKGVINIVNTQFYIAPLVNAAVRSGSMQEKIQMMKAFLESNELIYNQRKEEHEDIFTATARLLTNIRARQNRLRDKGTELISERVKEKNLHENKVLIVNVTDILDKNLTGLVANRLIDRYKRPILLIRYDKKSNTLSGSARGYNKSPIKDFKEFLSNTKLFNYCEGHPQAFGVSIDVEKIIEANNLINEKLKDIEIDTEVHDVDFIVPANQLSPILIEEINDLRDVWGPNVEEPLIAINNLEVNKDEVQIMGSKKNTLKIVHRGVEYIKFFSSEKEWNSIVEQGERLVLDIVGKCSVNIWKDKKTPQIIIEDYDIIKTKKKQLIF